MSQASCFDIQYWSSYGPFLSNKSKWNKIQSSFIVHHINYSNFFYLQYNNIPFGSVSTASSSDHFDHPYACIYYLIVEDFVVEIHHGHLHFFVHSVFFLILLYRSYNKYFTRYSYFENLKKTAFFLKLLIVRWYPHTVFLVDFPLIFQ